MPLTTPTVIPDRQVPGLLQQRHNAKYPFHKHHWDSGILDDPDCNADKYPRLPVPVGPQMNWLDPYVSHLVRDPRDTVFIKTSLWLSLCPLSALYLIFVHFTWAHFALHGVWLARHATTYVLMLHCVCHRPMYKPQYAFCNALVHYALSLFYGHTWESFFWHHIKHHHVEDNGPNDLSCTLLYQRDKPVHFAIYFLRFFLLTVVELPLYFFRKGWKRSALRIFALEACSWLVIYVLAMYVALAPTLLTLVAPLVLMRFGMMSGNWAQHAFVDPGRLDCDYVQSLTCIASKYNELAFNDGYHTSHHLNPRRHWADHPGNLIVCADEYARQGTLVFQGIDFHITWWYLMTHNFDALANAYVHLDLGSERPAHEILVRMLKDRVRQFSKEEVHAYYNRPKTA